ncbi:150_t:CDS:2 [Entrophospora sp. SA101]|nr:150_t:CDS:2 [Entrophospora sp. SA101]
MKVISVGFYHGKKQIMGNYYVEGSQHASFDLRSKKMSLEWEEMTYTDKLVVLMENIFQ